MSQIKFVYKSQNIPDTTPIEGSQHTITSGAVYEAISNIQMNTLFATGYLPEGIAQIEKQHKLSFEENTLKLETGSKLFIPSGIDEEDQSFIFNTVETTQEIAGNSSYSNSLPAYLFVDTTNNEFVARTKRTNNKNSITGEVLDSATQYVFAQKEQPAIGTASAVNGAIWWDLTTNRIKVFNSQADQWVEAEYSVPLAVVTCENNVITGIDWDFTYCGVCEGVTWVNPGVTFVIPTGTNPDKGTYTTQMLETTDVITKIFIEDTTVAFDELALYMNVDGEIEGPVDELTFDTSTGLFIDTEGGTHSVCRYALISTSHLTSLATDPLTVTEFVLRGCTAIADNDDIEYVIRLIGSSTGATIDDLRAELEDVRALIDTLKEQTATDIDNAKTEVEANMNDLMVHKKLPEGYDPDDVLSTISLDETILGTKTFQETIVGNITGHAQNVNIDATSNEIIPLGLNTFTAGTGNTIVSPSTTVRVGNNYVNATNFNGTALQTNWADLAEKYLTDEEYPVGTLVQFGGEKEMTIAKTEVNAVISEAPAVLMNNAMEGGQPVALAGRVKLRVVDKCKKFDKIYLSEFAGVGVNRWSGKPAIARALEDKDTEGEGLVLCAVHFSI